MEFVTRRLCEVELQEQCYDVPEETCHSYQKPLTTYREEQECHAVYKKECHTVHEEVCKTEKNLSVHQQEAVQH